MPGDISLLTRSQGSHWHWTDDIDVSHVYLSEKLVSGVANEMMDRSVAEVRLHDVLNTRDPVVTAAVQSIAAEATQRSIGGSLYVEAIATQLAVHMLRSYATVTLREASDKGRLMPSQTRRVTEYVESRLHEPLSLEALARLLDLGCGASVGVFVKILAALCTLTSSTSEFTAHRGCWRRVCCRSSKSLPCVDSPTRPT